MPATTKTTKTGGPNVRAQHGTYVEMLPHWKLIGDCIAGQHAIKAAGTAYLPKPNSADDSAENVSRYQAYLARAVFYEFTSRTLDGLVGQVFAKEPTIELPSRLALLENDADGSGTELAQKAKDMLRSVLSKGRAGVLADYPKRVTDEGDTASTTVAELEAGRVRPRLVCYCAEDVINWRTVTVGAAVLLSLVVIREDVETQDDGFEAETVEQFRVLRLTVSNGVPVHTVQLWQESADGNSFQIVDEFVPVKGNGEVWQIIPFSFVGPEDNGPRPNKPPLLPLANLNVAHYRNTADEEEAAFLLGQPTPWVSGMTQDWIDNVWKGTMQLGSRAVITAPKEAQIGLLQVQENTMISKLLEHKERQAVALGAKLIEQKQVQRTATEASQENAGEISILCAAAQNVTTAITDALAWCAEYVTAEVTEESPRCELNTDFEAARLTPQERAQLMSEYNAELLTFSEYRNNLRRAGLAHLDDEEARDEIDANPPGMMQVMTGQRDVERDENGNPIKSEDDDKPEDE